MFEEVGVTAVRSVMSVASILFVAALAWGGDATPSPAAPAKAAVRPADEKAIRAAVLAYLQTLRLMRGVTVEVEEVRGVYARVRTVPPPDTTDPAWVFAKKVKGRWTVLLGPGTEFGEAELSKQGIPRGLWLTPAR